MKSLGKCLCVIPVIVGVTYVLPVAVGQSESVTGNVSVTPEVITGCAGETVRFYCETRNSLVNKWTSNVYTGGYTEAVSVISVWDVGTTRISPIVLSTVANITRNDYRNGPHSGPYILGSSLSVSITTTSNITCHSDKENESMNATVVVKDQCTTEPTTTLTNTTTNVTTSFSTAAATTDTPFNYTSGSGLSVNTWSLCVVIGLLAVYPTT